MVMGAVATLVLPLTAAADPAGTDRHRPISDAIKLQSEYQPLGARQARTVKVMVEMAGDPVAVVQAKAGRDLTTTEKNRVKKNLKGKQDAIAGRIKGNGGKVLSQMQSAYNGMQVQVSSDKLDEIAKLPGVSALRPVIKYELNNATSVPYLGVPQVWQDTGYTGKGVKIAIIDTGVDYTHSDFGGPGTVEAFKTADATSDQAADPAWFGPKAPRVKGGYDFVGDAYNASDDNSVAKPDPNPLDCYGHGTHVAGSAAGGGVNPDGTPYTGPFDATTPQREFEVGPGVAPEADIYALRVFGCAGSTDKTTEAIDWAVANGMDVINMSLGSTYGTTEDATAIASTNAVASGVVVVAAAGNDGNNPYMVGSPATGRGVVAVAANDSTESFPGAELTVNDKPIPAINANGAALPSTPFTIRVIKDNPATPGNEALGCSAASYGTLTSTDIAVVERGACARVAKAIFGQQAGAGAVIMINSEPSYPPYEGEITENPDTGEAYTVTIPFLGVRQSDGPALVAADGTTLTMVAKPLPNPGFSAASSFTSGGPRTADSAVRPNLIAPGVSIASAGVGTGYKKALNSGTSMATPHVAGVAALAIQAHPTWSATDISSALVSTALPNKVAGYRLTLSGVGLVNPAGVVSATALATGDTFTVDGKNYQEPELSFGFQSFVTTYTSTKAVTLVNKADKAVTYTAQAVATPQSKKAQITVSPASVTVPAGGQATVKVTMTVNAADIPSALAAGGGQYKFYEVSGNVVFTAGSSQLRVPYLMVPRPDAKVTASTNGRLNPRDGGVTVTLSSKGRVATSADTYQWGLSDPKDAPANSYAPYDLRAVGVQSFADGDDQLLVFAVSSWNRMSNPSSMEYDIPIDSNGDGKVDKVLFTVDYGLVATGDADGRTGVFFNDLDTRRTYFAGFLASGATDVSTLLIPVYASDLGITGQFAYTAESYSLNSGEWYDTVSGVAQYNPWKPAVANGDWVDIPAGGKASLRITLDKAEAAKQRPLGSMIVVMDNKAGAEQAILIPSNK